MKKNRGVYSFWVIKEIRAATPLPDRNERLAHSAPSSYTPRLKALYSNVKTLIWGPNDDGMKNRDEGAVSPGQVED
jgi:hypothetical protein